MTDSVEKAGELAGLDGPARWMCVGLGVLWRAATWAAGSALRACGLVLGIGRRNRQITKAKSMRRRVPLSRNCSQATNWAFNACSVRIFRVTLFVKWQELLWRRRALDRASRPGNHRTAHSATAGTAPVPSHIAYFGGAVALGQSGGPLSRGTHGRFDGASAKIRRLSTR